MFDRMPTDCLCLIRHGETDWNALGRIQGREDTLLNANGRRQAEQTGLYLSQWRWSGLVSSPLLRARETAQIIARLTGIATVQEMPEFMERDYGECSGLTGLERRNRYPDGNIPGQEPLATLQQRVMSGLATLHDQGNYPTLVVAHGGVINAILANLSSGEIGTGKTILHNASMTVLQQVKGHWKVLTYNANGHL